MTIRRVLLWAFLGLIVASTGAMTALAYERSRTALERQIRLNLEDHASALMGRIDALMFERLQNLAGWRRLEVMQDLRLDDLDKRLARFLHDLVQAYNGVYRDLLAIRHDRIVAAATPGRIGGPAPPAPTAQDLHLNDTPIQLGPPQGPRDRRILPLVVPLQDAYAEKPLGRLLAELDWGVVEHMLQFAGYGGSEVYALLLDADGRLMASSSGGAEATWEQAVEVHKQAAELAGHGSMSASLDSQALGPVLLSWAESAGYRGLDSLGWKVLVLIPKSWAFTPIRRLLEWMLGLLALTVCATGLLAVSIAKGIGQPIQRLTGFTRRFAHDRNTPVPEVGGSSEVHELGRAFRDLTEAVRRYESDLLRMGKLAATGEMAANLSHEIRTPLGILRTSAQLLARRPGLDPEGREMAGYVIEECDRINQLVSTLLEAVRPLPPTFSRIPLGPTLEQVRQLIQGKFDARDIKLAIDLNGAPKVIVCDRDQLKQMLFNLLLNAVQILPAGGRVEIHALRVPGGVEIQVDDDGPGIPEADRERILEPFVTRRKGGTGLGLSIARELARLHGGHLACDDSSLGGTRFSLYLKENPEP